MGENPNLPESEPQQPAAGEAKPKEKPPDRRDRVRVPVDNMKCLVKYGNRTEIGTIVNISRKGLFFTGFGDYKRGTAVLIQYPYDPTKPAPERFQHADIMRVTELPGSIKRGYGVKLLDIRVKY